MFSEWRVCCLLCLFSFAAADNSFRFGLVYGSKRDYGLPEIVDGYNLSFNQVNSLNNGQGFLIEGKGNSTKFRFKFKFIPVDSTPDSSEDGDFETDVSNHEKLLEKMFTVHDVHFLGGSHPLVGKIEMEKADAFHRLNYHCCVGPDSLYELDYPTVFGASVSNKLYTRTLIRRLELSGLGKTAIIYERNNPFTNSTCLAAIEYHKESESVQERGDDETEIIESDVDPRGFSQIALDLKAKGFEAVIACLEKKPGKELVDAFHEAEHSLKAFFITVGPGEQKWIDSFTEKVRPNDLFSAAQWHHQMNYADDIFVNASTYAEKYIDQFETIPLYTAAGASAVGITLYHTIKKAFKNCDITRTEGDVDALLFDANAIACDRDENVTGYDLVLRTLAEIDMETFFGRIKFNAYRRNVGLVPVTTQVRVTKETEGIDNATYEIVPVLPVGLAQSLLKYPADNLYRDACRYGQFKGADQFQPCEKCEPGEYSDQMDADHCDSCPNAQYTDRTEQKNCEMCPEGTHTQIRGAKSIENCTCLPDYFHPKGAKGEACLPCVEGAFCGGNTTLPSPKHGYWSDPDLPAKIYSCDPAENCPGVGINCKNGYMGRMCASCTDGYFSVVQQCTACWDTSAIVLATLGLLLGWYVINVIVSRSVPSLEMILGWAQLANIIGDVDLHWTEMMNQMFGIANILDFDVDILEPSCLVSWGFKQNFITQLCLPVVMTIMSYSGYVGSTCVFYLLQKRQIKLSRKKMAILSFFVDVPENREQLREKWDKTIATFLSSVDVTYVTIAKYCFDVFKCNDVAGISVLRVDPDVQCNDSNHQLLMGFAAFGILFYVTGYLVYASWKLYDLTDRKSFANPTDVRRFGFMYKKYELDYNFTLAIVILRKLCFVLVLVYMNNPAFQIGAIAILINASLMIHVYTAPYVDTYLDVLFSFLLLALMFEAFGGLMFYSENLPETNREILEWIIMNSLFILVAVFTVIFVMEMTTKYKARFVMKMHRDYWRLKMIDGDADNSNRWGLKPIVRRFVSHKDSEDVSFELLETFDPAFVYKALRADRSQVGEWDKLTQLLKEFMSDQSDCSYLSMKRTAKFWRKLVDRFPELVDFLAVADERTRQKFVDVATNLYRNFYLTKKITRLPLINVTNWRDYAPMAQWLAIAPEEDRAFFLQFLSKMFRAAGQTDDADVLASKLRNGGHDPDLQRRLSIRSLSERERGNIAQQIRDGDPFFHSALERRLSGMGYSVDNPDFQPFTTRSVSMKSNEDVKLSRGSSQHSQRLDGVTEGDKPHEVELPVAESSWNRADSSKQAEAGP